MDPVVIGSWSQTCSSRLTLEGERVGTFHQSVLHYLSRCTTVALPVGDDRKHPDAAVVMAFLGDHPDVAFVVIDTASDLTLYGGADGQMYQGDPSFTDDDGTAIACTYLCPPITPSTRASCRFGRRTFASAWGASTSSW